MRKRIGVLILTGACLVASCFGQSAPTSSVKPPTRLTVYLDVEAIAGEGKFQVHDSFLKNRIESVLSRELRKLGDVAVVGDAKETMTILHVLAVNTVTTEGRELGYAFSVVATMPNHAPLGGELYAGNHWIFAGSSSERYIEGDCISAVASFDQDVLQHLREAFRRIGGATN